MAEEPPVGHPYRFTTLAHRELESLGPLGDAELDALLDGLPASSRGRVLDVGCGKGDLLVRLARRGARGRGIDRNPWFLDVGRERAVGAGVAHLVDLEEGDVAAVALGEGWDLVACIGATGALGGPLTAPPALAAAVRPGGTVLIGEGFWREPPEPAWLDSFGMAPDELLDRAGTLGRMTGAGFGLREVVEADEAGWDAYEASYAGAIERWAAAHPSDLERDAFLARAALMRDSYAAWRRHAMGFLVAVLERPANP